MTVGLLSVAGLAFWLSTLTDSPLGAVGGAVGIMIVTNILEAVDALGDLRQALPMYWQGAWLDLLRPEPSYGGMLRGAAVSVSYAVMFCALAFRRFRTKDIVS